MSKKSKARLRASRQDTLQLSKDESARLMAEYMAAPLTLGKFNVPHFDGLAATFGAKFDQYPPRDSIPEVPRCYHDIMSKLFFKGGKFEDFGLRLKPSIHKARAMTAIRAWMCSFEPKHEHKTETVAWALSEWFEDIA
jgi:hypothetical protein